MADQVLEELIQIKKLLVKAMMENGISQEKVAEALGKNQSQVSRMFAKGAPAKARRMGRKGNGAAAGGDDALRPS